MPHSILITGGAGFIGSHLADLLVRTGYRVRILDNLDPQIHPSGKPAYLNPSAEFIEGDVRDRDTFTRALDGIDAVFHFAAAVGTGQSMYQIEKYTSVNVLGLAVLLDILVNRSGSVPKVFFAGSATSYGECAHWCTTHGRVFPDLRRAEQLRRHDWELHCPHCDEAMKPHPIPEEQPLRPRFLYGLHKKACEEMLHAVAQTYNIPYSILRFFNVYGPRQSLTNPYTGVIAIFTARIKNNRSPIVIEDGNESRDFISVFDVVQACLHALEKPESTGQTINIGTGQATRIIDMANFLLALHKSNLTPVVSGEFRKNDFRHSLADISKMGKILNFEPRISFEQGMRELSDWTRTQGAIDNFEQAYQELKTRGLM